MGISSETESATEVIAAFQDGRLEGAGFVRALLAAPGFMVPSGSSESSEAFRTVTDADGTRWLSIYTDEPAVAEARSVQQSWLLEGEMVELSGRDVVKLLEPGDGLQINPDTTRALHYKPAQVPVLREALRAIDIEAALDQAAVQGSDPAALCHIGRYSDFRVVMRTTAAGAVLDLAPDTQGRRLLAAFTSQASLDLYLEATTDLIFKRGLPRVVALSGVELAVKLGELEILGVVFDCAGPGRPRALHAKLGERVLEALDESPGGRPGGAEG